MYEHVHIGASDIIGRHYATLPKVLVISHHELSCLPKTGVKSVSISAFDPLRKSEIVPSVDFIDSVCLALPSSCKIIYFSSARVLERNSSSRHAIYVENKMFDEVRLRAVFPNLSVVYLPLVIPLHHSDKNEFLGTFFGNLKSELVTFDVGADSSWNFIHPSDLNLLIDNIDSLHRRQLLVSKRAFTGHDFVRFAREVGKVNLVEFGEGVFHYPTYSDTAILYAEFDYFDNFDWLILLHRLYK